MMGCTNPAAQFFTAAMAASISCRAVAMSAGLCKQCAATTARRAFSSFSPRLVKAESLPTSAITRTPSYQSTIVQHEQFSPRHFSSTTKRSYKSVQEAKSRHKSGPFSWQAGILFLAAGVGLTFYFRYEKARMARERIAEQNKSIGKPLVGGAFHLTDHDGREFTDQDLKGRYSLVYFGFTHCPDICPEELDKMAGMIDRVKAANGEGAMRPVFISCDPARDTPEVIRHYLAEFHPDILGLVGTWQEVKDVCKAYRVYFSTPPDVKPGQDYLVDHSIYFYLMDPDGDFVEAIGRNFTVDAAAKVINDHIKDWKGKIDRS